MKGYNAGGGLALFWKDQVSVRLLSYSRNYVDVAVHKHGTPTWRLTGFYGYPERSTRRESWNMLRDLKNISTLPWCSLQEI